MERLKAAEVIALVNVVCNSSMVGPAAAEDWARQRGYTEVASDASLDNETSHAAHRRAGYQEVDRVVQFRKTL